MIADRYLISIPTFLSTLYKYLPVLEPIDSCFGDRFLHKRRFTLVRSPPRIDCISRISPARQTICIPQNNYPPQIDIAAFLPYPYQFPAMLRGTGRPAHPEGEVLGQIKVFGSVCSGKPSAKCLFTRPEGVIRLGITSELLSKERRLPRAPGPTRFFFF